MVTCSNNTTINSIDAEADPLISTLLSSCYDEKQNSSVHSALVNDGFIIIRNVLSSMECFDVTRVVRESNVCRDNQTTPDSGYLFGSLREIIAQRIFDPLVFQTRELFSSKEGYTVLCHDNDESCSRVNKQQPHSYYQYDSSAYQNGLLPTIQSLTAISIPSSSEECAVFSVYPGSHKVISTIAASKNENNHTSTSWVALSKDDLDAYLHKHDLLPINVCLSSGDVLLYRTDVVHSNIIQQQVLSKTRNQNCWTAIFPVSMIPASIVNTNSYTCKKKLEGYQMGCTTDHRPYLECWKNIPGETIPDPNKKKQTSKKSTQQQQQQQELIVPPDSFYYRHGPPLLTWREAELYGLVPYIETTSKEILKFEFQRALVRGVRFCNDLLSSSASSTSYRANTCPAKSTHDAKVAILSPLDDPLLGQDKWLGGMSSPDGNYVYGVPGTAEKVLRITVANGSIDFIGPSFKGKFKWLRGIEIPPSIEYPKGICICLPANADKVLEINPHTQEVSTYGGPFPGPWKWHGGSFSHQNGFVYAIPANAEQVLRINPHTRETKLVGPKFIGPQKWYGGLRASNGCIYGIPLNASGVLKIVPATVNNNEDDEIYMFGNLPEGNWKWHGGAITGDGRMIYGFPSNSDYVLKIDTKMDTVSFLGGPHLLKSGRQRKKQDGKYKYLGGAIAPNDHLYLFPCDSEQVLSINTRTDEVKLVGPVLTEGGNKFQNGFCARDGAVYGIPQHSRGVIRISPNKTDPEHGEPDVDLIYCGEKLVATKDKFEGGVLGKDGCIYCIPLRAKRVLKVIPSAPVTDEMLFMNED